jgi:BON domain-containing protein
VVSNLGEAREDAVMIFSRRFVWTILGCAGILLTLFSDWGLAVESANSFQTAGKSDKSLGREIHNAIVSDSTLPYCAHIVSVRVQGGVVTLNGRVRTIEEKEKLRMKASSLAGEQNVVSNISFLGKRSHP